MNKDLLIKNIKAATKAEYSDLVIKNINIVDVFQASIFTCDVAISNGFIVGLGKYSGLEEIDGTGKFICPGLIDGHVHIESSMITPAEYYKIALLHGVTSVVTDPHEIANVFGIDGINFMINSSNNLPFDFHFMLPSCVPATSFESSGANLNYKDLKSLYENPKVLGLAEVMNCPAVLNCDEDMINKIYDAIKNNTVIDGHGAGFNIDEINAYATSYIKTDHECCNYEELIDRVRRGIYVLIREGTVAKNLDNLIKGASIFNSRRLCLCTDDKHIDDLYKDGSIDFAIKKCINGGLSAEIAIQMATLNTAECYNLKNKGAIAPGYIADFLILDNLNEFKINSVYKNGKLVVKDNTLINICSNTNIIPSLSNAINIPNILLDDLKISTVNKSILNVIKLIPNKLETIHIKSKIKDFNFNNEFISLTDNRDLIKVAVIERHRCTGNIGLGVINGLNLKFGAIATTIAHDSHNMIVCGTNDSDMLFAIDELKKINGGIVIVNNGSLLASISLEIGGLMTSRNAVSVINDLKKLHKALDIVAPNITFNPFLTLSFLSLPVIPDIKITDKGLFDVKSFKFINITE